MATPRAKTLQQRFGFADGDLKTPKHDEMMLWLDENIEQATRIAINWAPLWDAKNVEKLRETAQNAWANSLAEAQDRGYEKRVQHLNAWQGLGPVPSKPDIQIERTTWEATVISKGYRSEYIIGFVDLLVVVQVTRLSLSGLNAMWAKVEYNELPAWQWFYRNYTICFEVKSSIRSLGEVIRQIRMYQQYQGGLYVIVCPDDRFAGPLRKQGIDFLKYDPR